MTSATLLQVFLFGVAMDVATRGVKAGYPFNNPPGVDIWCGKAYRETNASFDPGGWLFAPNATSPSIPLMELRIYPRYSFYLASEKKASFIIDMPVQHIAGQTYENWTFDPVTSPSAKIPFTEVKLWAANGQTSDVLINWKARIPVNSSGNEVEFDLGSSGMKPDPRHPWTVTAMGNSPDDRLTYHGGTFVTILPERNDTGSVARIDYLYGSLEVKSSLTNNTWKPIFPYSFYTSWDWIASTINNSSATKNLYTFRKLGYNIIHPIPPGGNDPFNYTIFKDFLDICDELELYVMYDMRHTYQNQTSVSDQLSRLQSHPSLLLYYTADEPDGACDPLNATELSYKHIKSIDPYHPISLVLNCANFYFGSYTAGADIILEDVYPIAVNTSFSTVYHTVCNATYGDCGCDNCHANDPAYLAYVTNPFLDIIERTDSMYTYQEWTGKHAKKPVWGVPQAFWDNGSFWDRYPTAQEEATMALLRINHGAKGIVAWSYPTSPDLEGVTSSLASLITSPSITKYILGAKRIGGLEIQGAIGLIDASAWVRSDGILVSYVYFGYTPFEGSVAIVLPGEVQELIKELWGPGGWEVGWDNKRVVRSSIASLEAGILEFARK